MKKTLALAAVVTMATACGSDPFEGQGTVVKKKYQPAYETTCVGTGTGVGSNGQPVVVVVVNQCTKPPAWYIWIDTNEEGKVKTRKFNVEPSVWESCDVGEIFDGKYDECEDL